MHVYEQSFRNCHESRQEKTRLRHIFIDGQRKFDKVPRQKARAYNRGLVLQIEELQTKNPKEFWRHIKNLGPRASKDFPLEVYENENLVTNLDAKNQWSNDVSDLYNRPDNLPVGYDAEFYRNTVNEKNNAETILNDNQAENEYLNYNILILMSAKLKKSCRYR